jgi:polyphosphate kinase
MVRNIDHRIETTIPVYSPSIQKELQHMLDIQMSQSKPTKRKTTTDKTPDIQDQVYHFIQSLSQLPLKKNKS